MLFYYHFSPEFPKFNIYVYDDITDVIEMINQDETEEKWVLFQSNKETARRVTAKNIKHATAFVTADDKECNAMKEIVTNQCFKEKILITMNLSLSAMQKRFERLKKEGKIRFVGSGGKGYWLFLFLRKEISY